MVFYIRDDNLIKIPQQKPYADMSVLIIDGQALVHTVIRDAFLDAGIHNVKSAYDAYAASRLCDVNDFDIVLIAFDVKSDKDGFNLLEEMKFKGQISKTTCVIFLSADTTQGLVNCVVEMEPTDFWVKPLDKSKVEKRIKQILLIEKKLYALRYCFDQEEYPTTIYYAERQLKDQTLAHYHPHINRIIGRSLFNLQEYQGAYDFYSKLALSYKYAWVQVGLVATLLKLQQVDQANELAATLLEREDTKFATYDLLAEYHITREDYQVGYEIIQEATKLAPRSIERNKKSWNLARLNHDKLGQYIATKNMAKYAKNSIHDCPSLSMNVIRSSLDLASSVTEGEAAKILTITESKIAQMLHEYPASKELTEQLHVIQARLLNLRDKKQDAEELMQNQVKVRVAKTFEDSLDKIKAFHEVGMWEQSMLLLDKLKDNFEHDSFTGKVLAEYLEQESKERRHIRYSPKELGEMASVHYKHRRYKPAHNLLAQARELSPNNINLTISHLKILAYLAEQDTLEEEVKPHITECFEKLAAETLTEKQQTNVDEYIERITKTGFKPTQEYA